MKGSLPVYESLPDITPKLQNKIDSLLRPRDPEVTALKRWVGLIAPFLSLCSRLAQLNRTLCVRTKVLYGAGLCRCLWPLVAVGQLQWGVRAAFLFGTHLNSCSVTWMTNGQQAPPCVLTVTELGFV